MTNSKSRQKANLSIEFGILIQPLTELASANSLTPTDCRIAIAKVDAGLNNWSRSVESFVTLASDIVLNDIGVTIRNAPIHAVSSIRHHLNNETYKNNPNQLREEIIQILARSKAEFIGAVDQVPIDWLPEIFAANTPYTAYLRIKEVVDGARIKFHYFDRYLKRDFVDLFLHSVSRNLEIRLVTTRRGISAVEEVSKLAAREFSNFRLVEADPSAFHDRNLRIDDKLFSLGPSIDRAGIALTNFGPTQASPDTLRAFDQLIASGTVIV